MTRQYAIALNICLSHKELKVKFLSGPAYASLIELKRPLVKYLSDMGEDEKMLMTELGITDFGSDDKGFKEKMSEIQKREFSPKELNFIPSDEFKRFTDEADFNTGATLAEYLLKP